MLATFTKRAPGLGAAVATAAGGVAVATQMPESLHISGIPCSLVLGAVANNLAPANIRQALQPGVKFATTTVLRAGIVAVGAKLSAVPERLPWPDFINQPEHTVALLLQRQRGRWDDASGRAELADALQVIAKAVPGTTVESLLSANLPAPPPARVALPKAVCWLLRGEDAAVLRGASQALKRDLADALWVADDLKADPLQVLALRMEVERQDGLAMLVFARPGAVDLEARAKALGVKAQVCGRDGQVQLSGALTLLFPRAGWAKPRPEPWVSDEGRLALVAVRFHPEMPEQRWPALRFNPGTTLHPTGGRGTVQLTPTTARHVAFDLVSDASRLEGWSSPDRKRWLFLVDSMITEARLAALHLPPGWRARVVD